MKTPDANPDTPDDAWDALFRQRLGDYTAAPPTDALNRILPKVNPPRPPAYGRWLPLGLAALLLIGVGGWLFVHKANRVLQPVGVTASQNRLAAQPHRPTVKAVVPDQIPASRTSVDEPQGSVQELVTERKDGVEPIPKLMLPTESGPTPTAFPGRREDPLVVDKQKLQGTDDLLNKVARPTKTATAIDRANGANQRAAVTGRQFPVVSSPHSVPNQQQAGRSGRLAIPSHQPGQRSASPLPDGRPTSELTYGNMAKRYESIDLPLPTVAESRLLPVDVLINHPFRLLPLTATLPPVLALAVPVVTPQASRAGRHPAWFVSLTPLYNYQQIDPIHTDAELVSDIRVARPLATDRLGGRLQIGTEWQLTSRLRFRTSMVYQQIRQSLRYAVQSTQPDSVQVVVTNQSVQVTPIFTRRSYAETATWHYAGLSTDLVWQLNRQTSSPWQHYLTVGATLGRFVRRGGAVNGFVQAGYGIERPLTTGLRLRIEPTVQLGWQALTDATQRLQSRPYGYGLALGLRLR